MSPPQGAASSHCPQAVARPWDAARRGGSLGAVQTVVKGTPPDLIAYAWFGLGYRPRESLVLVGLHGSRRRTGEVVRYDLPERSPEAAVPGAVAAVRSLGATAALALVMTDAERPRLARLARSLRRELADGGGELIDALLVGSSSYRSLLCRDPRCCPPHGHPLDRVWSSEAAAVLVAAGHVLASDETELMADVAPVDPQCAWRASPAGDEPASVWLRRWRDALFGGLRLETAARPLVEQGMAGALADGRLRDAILMTVIPGSGLAAEESALGGDPGFGLLMETPPDEDVLDRAEGLLSALARHAPSGERADVLAVMAWLSWWGGTGARTRLLAERSRADRPDQRLAGLVLELLAHAVAPPWAARVRAQRPTS